MRHGAGATVRAVLRRSKEWQPRSFDGDGLSGPRADVADARVACVPDGWPDLAVRAERSEALSARVVLRYPRGSSEPRDRFSCIADTFSNERHYHVLHVLPNITLYNMLTQAQALF